MISAFEMKRSSGYSYKTIAESYDEEVSACNRYLHEVIVGMTYEFTSAGESLLDIGIGTGLAA